MNYSLPAGHKGIKNWMAQGDERLPVLIGYCKNFRTVIDAGAFVGHFTRYFAKRFKDVYAYEPINYQHLENNTKDLENVHLSSEGISDKIEVVNMGVNHVGFGGIAHKASSRAISCVSIDSLNLENVDLIKLDLEGMDLKGLQGAINTINRDKPVIMVEDKYGGKDIHAYLESIKYKKVWGKKPDSIWTK